MSDERDRVLDEWSRDRERIDVSDDFTDRVMAAVRARRSEGRRRPVVRRVLAFAAASAALVVFAFRVASVLSLFSG